MAGQPAPPQGRLADELRKEYRSLLGPARRHRQFLMLSFETVATLDEVAAELGLSPQRVDQIEKAALAKLAAALLYSGYTLSDLTPDCES